MNPYAVLGVEREASDDDIKSAYRRLVKEHHPDMGGSAEKFREVKEAYELLSDPEKRAAFDSPFVGDIFTRFGFDFGRKGYDKPFTRWYEPPKVGDDIQYDLNMTFEEMALGCAKTFTITRKIKCSECKGVGGDDVGECRFCDGKGKIKSMRAYVHVENECGVCHGKGTVPRKTCIRCGGSGLMHAEQKINLKLSPGVQGTCKIEGYGHEMIDGKSGDLYVRLRVRKHEFYNRSGLDILCTLKVSAIRAMLGCDVDVPTIHGQAKLTIPPGTQNETTAILHGEGIWSDRGKKGDQHVKIRIVVPNLTEKQKELLTEILINEIEQGKDPAELEPLKEVLRK